MTDLTPVEAELLEAVLDPRIPAERRGLSFTEIRRPAAALWRR